MVYVVADRGLLCFERKDSEIAMETLGGEGRKRMIRVD